MKQFSRSVENSAASVMMEGFIITEEDKALCEKLKNNEITMNDYINIVLAEIGFYSFNV